MEKKKKNQQTTTIADFFSFLSPCSFPSKYPQAPLINISFEVENGVFSEHDIQHFKDRSTRKVLNLFFFFLSFFLSSDSAKTSSIKCTELVGQPMVYALVESLQEILLDVNIVIGEGSFMNLSDEIILRIFSFMEPKELCVSAMVNRNFRRISEDQEVRSSKRRTPRTVLKLFRRFGNAFANDTRSLLRRNLTQRRCFGKTFILKQVQSLTLVFWFCSALLISFWLSSHATVEYKFPELLFTSSITARRGTSDEWPIHLDWKENFKKEVTRRFQCELDRKGRVVDRSTNCVVGYYRFTTLDEIRKNRALSQIDWELESPYTLQAFAAVQWFPKPHSTRNLFYESLRTMWKVMVSTCRCGKKKNQTRNFCFFFS
jgi:hypothetical protein